MGEWHEFRELRRYSLNYRVVLLATFLITVIFDLTLAVEIGMVLASLFFIYRVQTLSGVERLALPAKGPDGESNEGIAAFHLFGSMFFGSVGKIEDELDVKQLEGTIVVLDMYKVINLDTTALEMLDNLLRDLRKAKADLVLCGLNKQPLSIIQRSGFADRLGNNHFCDTLQAGVEAARLLRKLA